MRIHLKKSVILTAILTFVVVCCFALPPTTPIHKALTFVENLRSDKSMRPNIVPDQEINCTYFCDTLSFNFLHDEGQCEIIVIDENMQRHAFSFDSEIELYVNVGNVVVSQLIIVTEYDNVYECQF